MRKRIALIALIVVGTIIVIAAWVVLLGLDKGGAKATLSDNDVIVLGDETLPSEESAEIVQEENDTEFGEVLPTSELSEEDKSLIERLSAVEGMIPGADTGWIFVGDSRFVNMNTVCNISKNDNLFMVAKVGEGYSWFSNSALQQIKRITSSGLFSKWKLIICLGINDLGSREKYVKKYEEIKNDYDMILVSVNPVDHYGNLTNEEIDRFNSALKELSLPYIDTYNILMSTGYSTSDGLHYKADTTKKIYDGILLGLEDMAPGTLIASSEGLLDNASLGKKNSLQSDILAQNKYVRKESTPGTIIDESVLKEILEAEEALEEEAAAAAEGGGTKQKGAENAGGEEEQSTESTEALELIPEESQEEKEARLEEERREEERREAEKAEEKRQAEEQEEEERLEREKREEEERKREEEERREREEREEEERRRREEEENEE